MTTGPSELARREVLAAFAGMTAAALVGAERAEGIASGDDAGGMPRAYRGEHAPKPLPFDPGALRGLSRKLLQSHYENNYSGAVKRLNLIQQQIGRLMPDAAPYQLGALKREELIATNSMLLHELYFGNLGGDGKMPASVSELIKAQYGSLATWERDFRQTGLSLAGGSGWVILAYDPHRQAVHNYWSWDHTHSVAGGTPLLVMDMYEHSYAIDYGANARAYIDAFFQNLQWDEVERRAEAARTKGQGTPSGRN
jgi:Fe-Mn family superoxide dismutase